VQLNRARLFSQRRDVFFEIGVPVPQGATAAAPPTKEEIERLLAAAPRYGIEIKLPGL
jgi:hypothetical protein